jgi:hypothetical protein
MNAKQNRMVDLAMRFYREAEAPSEGTWHALFQLLVLGEEQNLAQLVRNNTEEK